MMKAADIQVPSELTYFLGSSGGYGYPAGQMIRVKVLKKTAKRVKCEFMTRRGTTVQRWLAASNLSPMRWRQRP